VFRNADIVSLREIVKSNQVNTYELDRICKILQNYLWCAK